jgi:hypothetical protein
VTTAAGSGERSSRRSDRAPQVANLRIGIIGSGSLGGSDQKRLHARIDHDPRFFVRVKVSSSVRLDHCGALSKSGSLAM